VAVKPLRPAVFLDKDGTLIEDVPYNVDPASMRLVPGALTALRRLHDAGFGLVVVSNQSGVARGLFPESALRAVAARLQELVAPAGVELEGVYFCPHHPEGTVRRYAVECHCRKPRPGLLQRAARDLGLDMRRSWLIGDILNDVEAGVRAGCRTVLLDVGNETEWLLDETRLPHLTATGLEEAVSLLLEEADEPREFEVQAIEGGLPA
jgi:D-glycero-D-manno-heptose 1,7-bisphosphate phosphatase